MTRAGFTREKVYDVLLRLMHGTLALSVMGLGATGWGSELFEDDSTREAAVWNIHFLLGDVLAVTLALRLVWGLVGPEHARWKDLWHPTEWLGLLKGRWPTARRFGHDVMASASYLAVYAVLLGMVGTGLVMAGADHGTGPLSWLYERVDLGEWLEEPHEAGAALAGAFFVLHLGAMSFHQFVQRHPTLQSMFNGYQYQPTKES
jgi:cytochrome b561